MEMKTLFSACALAATSSAEITLATFEASDPAYHSWTQKNDPVMGGQSKGTFSVSNGIGTMNGTCAIVPFLKAPGFIKAETSAKFADVSSCTGIQFEVRSTSSPDPYTGYRVSFGNDASACKKFFARGYKADLAAPSGTFSKVQIPFNKFTSCWDDATGKAIKSCGEDASVCPTQNRLQDLQSIAVWAEGVVGNVKLDLKSVSAYGCGGQLASGEAGALVSFDGSKATTFTFKELNDPVMGGKSTGTWSLGQGFGILDGEIVNVPSLKAPGFIKAAADGRFPDISAFINGSLVLSVRTSTPEYAGYRVTFVSGAVSAGFACAGGGGLPLSRGCFKNKFSVPAGSDFVDIKIPFNTFSDKWSSATGEQTVTCAADASVCPTAAKLAKIQRVEFWGEGALGKLHLEVKSVRAESTSGESLVLV
jgi:hypothetical protein